MKNIPPDSFEPFLIIERFSYRDEVNRSISSKELKHRFVDKRVGGIIEVIRNEEVTYLKYPILIEKDGSENSSFGVGTMRENFEVQRK